MVYIIIWTIFKILNKFYSSNHWFRCSSFWILLLSIPHCNAYFVAPRQKLWPKTFLAPIFYLTRRVFSISMRYLQLKGPLVWLISGVSAGRGSRTNNLRKTVNREFCSCHNFEYYGVVHVGLARFELQRHKLVKFEEENICSCHPCICEQQDSSLGGRKSHFANANKAFYYYF